VFLLEPRDRTPDITFPEITGLGEFPREYAFTERRVSDDLDPKLFSRVDQSVLLMVREPGGEFDLKGVDLGDYTEGV